ncbi:MAG TPA: hypothetical protein VJ324_00635, partial [Candidatus Acidoferrum sp.]|nr:hypothetical protein [Candidatus Acidoferrum sp.]
VATLTTEQMAAIAGLYWNREDDDFERVQVKDGKLQIELGGEFRGLKPAGEAHFHVADVPWGDDVDIHFLEATAEKPRRIEQSFGGGKPNIFDSATAYTPTSAELAEYVGPYVSEEIDPVYRMVLQDGNLTLTRLKSKPDTLHPAVRDVFTGEIGTVRFTRDANQHISGFILDAGRIQNFHFSRKTN